MFRNTLALLLCALPLCAWAASFDSVNYNWNEAWQGGGTCSSAASSHSGQRYGCSAVRDLEIQANYNFSCVITYATSVTVDECCEACAQNRLDSVTFDSANADEGGWAQAAGMYCGAYAFQTSTSTCEFVLDPLPELSTDANYNSAVPPGPGSECALRSVSGVDAHEAVVAAELCCDTAATWYDIGQDVANPRNYSCAACVSPTDATLMTDVFEVTCSRMSVVPTTDYSEMDKNADCNTMNTLLAPSYGGATQCEGSRLSTSDGLGLPAKLMCHDGGVTPFECTLDESQYPVVLFLSPSPQLEQFYGASMQLTHDALAISAYATGANEGRVYLYARHLNATTPDAWHLTQTLAAPEPFPFYFGWDVSVTDEFVAVTQLFPAQIHLYDRVVDPFSFTTTPLKVIDAEAGTSFNLFGSSVVMDGDWLLVGDAGHTSNTGAVFLYSQDEGGADNWGLVRTFLGVSAGGVYGEFVEIGGSTQNDLVVAVAAKKAEVSSLAEAGEVYIYKQDEGGLNQWGLVTTLNAAALFKGFFGSSISLTRDGRYLAVSSLSNYVKVYDADNAWAEFFTALPIGSAQDFGFSVSLTPSGDRLVVGHSNTVGKVYYYDAVFDASGDIVDYVIDPSTPFTPWDHRPSDSFGYRVGAVGTLTAVTSHADDTQETDAGIVYMFDTARQFSGSTIAPTTIAPTFSLSVAATEGPTAVQTVSPCPTTCGPYIGCITAPGTCDDDVTEAVCLANPDPFCDLSTDYLGTGKSVDSCSDITGLPTPSSCPNNQALLNQYNWILENLQALDSYLLSPTSASIRAQYEWLVPLATDSFGCRFKLDDYFTGTVGPTATLTQQATTPFTQPATDPSTLAPTAVATDLSVGSCSSTLVANRIFVGHIIVRGQDNPQFSVGACCASCEAQPRCVGWVYEAQQHRCTLREEFGFWKSTHHPTKYSGILTARVDECISTSVLAEAADARIEGSIIPRWTWKFNITKENCCQRCVAQTYNNCIGFRWRGADGRCQLMDQIRIFNNPAPGWTSASMIANPETCTTAEPCPNQALPFQDPFPNNTPVPPGL